MNNIINETVEEFKGILTDFFEDRNHSIEDAENILYGEFQRCCSKILSKYYEQLDDELLADKAGRKAQGLRLVRRKDPRRILSRFGEIDMSRSYYVDSEGTYSYPIDAVSGLEKYERVSLSVAKDLCERARQFSYAKAAEQVTGDAVSKQTVMNKVRMLEKTEDVKMKERRHVPFLHIDADEDHVSLQDGKNVIIPLISVYEGIEKQNARNRCKNIVHFPYFATKASEMWSQVSAWIEENYDIHGTKIYVHGDGGSWIQEAKEWIPGCIFVLDRYHYNKYKKKVVACLEGKERSRYLSKIRNSIQKHDEENLIEIWKELLEINPDREEALKEAFVYLLNNMEAIAVYTEDEEARNGGATEPHVSHVLSERLSMRPLSWSRETLEHIVPFLGSGQFTLKREEKEILPILKEKMQRYYATKPKNTLGLVDPGKVILFPRFGGRVTQLFRTFNSF